MKLPPPKETENYLNAKEFPPNTMLNVSIIGEGQMTTMELKTGGTRDRLKIPIRHDQEETTISIGSQSWDKIGKIIDSDDTADWIGWDVQLLVLPYPQFNTQGFVVMDCEKSTATGKDKK